MLDVKFITDAPDNCTLGELQVNADVACGVADHVGLEREAFLLHVFRRHNIEFIHPQQFQHWHNQQTDIAGVIRDHHVQAVLIFKRGDKHRDDTPAVDKHIQVVRVALQYWHAVGRHRFKLSVNP